MNMPDINIVKYLSVNIKKAFDKGEIDKVYRDMYNTAEIIAAEETRHFMNKMLLEWQEKMFGIGGNQEDTEPSFTIIPEYKSKRIQFHLDQMYRLLELYAKSKSINSQT
jgi:hypothetical protein